MKLSGAYGEAEVFTDDVELEAQSQIINLLNQEMSTGAHVRIMPDVHAGAGCVIGYTAKLTGKIVPNLIGVDIGCGVASWKLGPRHLIGEKYDKLDKLIRREIPSGRNVQQSFDEEAVSHIYAAAFLDARPSEEKFPSWKNFLSEIERTCKDTDQKENYVLSSIGTLGGGNHFIEIDLDDADNLWLTIHSGSRNFGLKIARHHQSIAEQTLISVSRDEYDAEIEKINKTKKGKGIEAAIRKYRNSVMKKGKSSGLEYLEGAEAEAYLRDMRIAQIYAQLNRRVMGSRILSQHYKMDYFEPLESVHNYINFSDKIIRKGAISAHKDEELLIPLNMAEGIILGTGKGNPEWNFSAPHGAGRKMSRSRAKQSIRLEDFQYVMKKSGVFSTSVGKHTKDEAPQAYKKSDMILQSLDETVEIIGRMKPVYNFKASE